MGKDWIIKAVVAEPDDKAIAYLADSKEATAVSKLSLLGLAEREYSYWL